MIAVDGAVGLTRSAPLHQAEALRQIQPMNRRTRTSMQVVVLVAAPFSHLASRADPTARAVVPHGRVQAARESRLVEPRLAGGLAYAPWTPGDTAHVMRVRRDAALLLASSARTQGDTTAAQLALGDADAVIRRLAGTSSIATDTQAVDLSAAHLVRYAHSEEALDAARALDFAQRALLGASRAEARFNRALAFSALGLSDAARREWRAYAVGDSPDAWQREAMVRARRTPTSGGRRAIPERRAELGDQVEAGDWAAVNRTLDAAPQIVRLYLDDELLPAWANAIMAGQENHARQLLANVRRLGAALWRRHQEGLYRGLVDDVSRAMSAGPGRPGEVARAVLDLLTARRLVEQNRFVEARAPLERARPAVAGVPGLAASAELSQLYIDWHFGERVGVLRRSADLARRSDRAGFVYFLGRALMLRASTLDSLTRYAQAQAAYVRAASVLGRSGEDEYAASSYAMLAYHLAMQGDLDRAWAEQRRAFVLLDEVESPRRRTMVLANAVVLASRFGLPYAARAFQTLLIEEVRRWADPGALARQLIEGVRLDLDLGDTSSARRGLPAVAAALASIADVSYRATFEEDARVEQARFLAIDDPAEAARLLGDSIERLSRGGRVYRVAELRLARGRALARAGRDDAALQDWLAGIERFEDQRIQVGDEQLRILHFARAWELYDEAIASLVRRGQPDRALALVERSHARALLDALAAARRAPVAEPRRTRAVVSAGELAIIYRSLPSELLIWTLDGQSTELTRVPVDARTLRRLADESLDAASDVDRRGALTRALLVPIAHRLAGVRDLVIVPDSVVARVSFAALPLPAGGPISSDSAPLLVERLSVTYAPGLAFLEGDRRTRAGLAAPRVVFFAESDASGRPDRVVAIARGASRDQPQRQRLSGANRSYGSPGY